MKLSIVLPAFNEACDLPRLFERLKPTLEKIHGECRVIVVDDGSTDETVSIVRRLAQEHIEKGQFAIDLVQHSTNQGLGGALRSGLQRSLTHGDDVVIIMDADNSHDPNLIQSMLDRIATGDDVVIASRFVEGGQMIGVPFHRAVLSHTASFVLRRLFRIPGVTDYSSGYRAYRTSILRAVKVAYGEELISENDFACCLELLLRLHHTEARVSEIPLVLRYDLKTGPSKMRIWRTVRRYFAVLKNHTAAEPARRLA